MSRLRKGWFIGGGIFLLILGILTGCQDQAETEIRTRPQDLLDAPDEHIGETVSISGEVNQVFTPRSFTVGGSDFGENLLIVSSDTLAPVEGRTEEIPTAERDIVQVTGVVQRFDSTEFNEEYEVSLPGTVASEFQGEPAVVAVQGSAAMHGIIVSPRLSVEDPSTVNDLAMATDLSQQSTLHRRTATFPSAPIQGVVQERIFWIGQGENQRLLVVMNPESLPDVRGENTPQPGEEWALHGIFRELPPPGILQTDWALNEEQISALEDHEVYLNAISAEPVDGATPEN